MARSFRRHPVPNMSSEKQEKKYWHGVMRSTEKRNLRTHDFTSEIAVLWCAGCPTCGFTDGWDLCSWDKEYLFYYAEQYNESGKDFLTTHFREVSNPWDMAKDGKYSLGREGLRSSKMNPRHTPRLVIHDTENYCNPASNWRK
jgi:hypothetical protein